MPFIDSSLLPDKTHFVGCVECLRTGVKQERCTCPCHDKPCGVCGRPSSWHKEGKFWTGENPHAFT